MKTNFLQTCVGISLVLLSLGFFFNSINSTQAAPGPEKFLQQGVNQIGKYMMMKNEADQIFIWDTETGKSVYYTFGGNYTFVKSKYQLPEKPME